MSNNKIFDYEVIIVGAGIAGISAAKILDNNNISNIVIEANNRVGGRAKKAPKSFGHWFDLGCSYLHEGEINPFRAVAKSLNVPMDHQNGDIFSIEKTKYLFGAKPLLLNKKKRIEKSYNNFLVKLATAVTHLIGNPNHDAMAGKYYARFHVKHEDNSDSYLRKAYVNMDLHTDGTYVREKTDWLLMQKMEEKNVDGGETALLHLDDWEHLEELFNDPVGKESFIWGSPKSKNINYKVEHPVFSQDKNGKPEISYIDQFPEPKNMKQGLFLQKLSDALEGSKKIIVTPLQVGCSVVANNYFWLHGRKPFAENKNLSRELLRIRGSFFTN